MLATAAAQSSSRETSPANTSAAPPSAAIAAAVSSAARASRSSSMTRPPSRAKSSALARPLPIFSPAVWPAPAISAILPASRPGSGGIQAPRARAMTICCTSSVPSPIVRIFASR